MIKVEFLEQYRNGSVQFQIGDQLSFDDEVANAMVKAGVAKNIATGEQNEKSLKPVVIQPAKVVQKAK